MKLVQLKIGTAAAIASLALISCTSGGGLSLPDLSSLPTGQTAGFDQAKFNALISESGTDLGNQNACLAYLDTKLVDLLVAGDGALYKGVGGVSNGPDSRSFTYEGHKYLACGIEPRPGYTCNSYHTPAQFFTCGQGMLKYHPSPIPS